jgi:glycosyltransferase involved in cell wall biosynthesis
LNNSEKTEILYLTRWYPPESGHFVKDIARACSLYCRVTVIVAIPDPRIRFGKFRTELDPDPELPLQTVRVYFGSLTGGILTTMINPLLYLMAQVIGYQLLVGKGHKFDLVHVHVLTRTALFALILKLFRGTPYIITEYWTRYLPDSLAYHGFVRRKVTSMLVKKADAMVCISQYLAEAMIRQGLKNHTYRIIPLAIRTVQFTPRVTSEEKQVKRIIHISTFNNDSKNVFGMLRVVKRLSLLRNDFELHMVGGAGKFLNETVEFARTLDPDGKFVFFHPARFGIELAEEIRQSSFLLMFSNYETFSAVIQECLSCGIPAVVARAGAVPEYFDPGSGILVDPGDEDALVRSLDYMLDHYRDYDGNELRENVVRRFSYEVIGNTYYKLYKQLSS